MHWCAKERNAKWDSCSGGVTLSDKLGIAASALPLNLLRRNFSFLRRRLFPFKNPLLASKLALLSAVL